MSFLSIEAVEKVEQAPCSHERQSSQGFFFVILRAALVETFAIEATRLVHDATAKVKG